jgi:O-antigen/teichoic acid export membrane protein
MTIGRVLYPKINEEIGKSDTGDMGKFVVVPARLLSLVVAMALGALVIITPLLITTYFKKYLPAINCTILLLLGGFFVSLNQNGINYLVAANKQRSLLYFIVTALSVNVIVCFGFIKAGFGIIGIALGQNISSVVFTSLIWYSVFFHLKYPIRNCFYYLLKLYLPFIITGLCLGALILFRHLNTENNYLTLGVYLVSYCIFFAALVWFFPLFSELKGDVQRVIKMRGGKIKEVV